MRIIGIEQGFEEEPTYLEIPENLDLSKENEAWKKANQSGAFVDWLIAHGAKHCNFDYFSYSTNPQPVSEEDKGAAEIWAKEVFDWATTKPFFERFLGWNK